MVPALVLLLLLGTPTLRAQEAKTAEGDPSAKAMQSLTRMSKFLSAAKQFRATVEIGYDIVQDWGQKIEFGETRVITVRRPDRLRADTTDRDGSTSGIVFDGKQIAVFDTNEKVYATVDRPGSIDGAIAYFVNDLGMRLPMANLLSDRLPQKVKDWANDIAYVDQSTVGGVSCDHIALRGNWEDVQMWIARGDRPLLQREVITYKRAEGQPQFWAQFKKWNLAPKVSDSVFTFTPPPGLAKVPFAPQKAAARVGNIELKGGKP